LTLVATYISMPSKFPKRFFSKAAEIMRMTAIGSIGILFAWTAASGLSAAPADTATVAPPKTLAVERNAPSGWQIGYAEADITPAAGEAMLAGFGQPRQVAGTLAPLRAQALAFEDGRGAPGIALHR
jgi:hypothetical protein